LLNTEDESQGMPTVVDWSAFPPEVRQALGKLRRGWSSIPVELGGSTYLFQVIEWIEPDPDAQIEAARAEMISAARRAAWTEFVAGLRASADIRIVRKNLPFRYVLDESE
jgi:alkylation response protein AidB-like acyl-CoA dehydrogenase